MPSRKNKPVHALFWNKSIYDDLELLELYGMDVQAVRGKTYGYFLGEREFQLPELKLLIDVCLTFDDGPSKTTPDVLSALNRAGVKATFFVVATGNNNKYLSPNLLGIWTRRW